MPDDAWLQKDDFDDYLREELKDPVYVEQYRIACEKMSKLKERLCSEGQCVEYYDPETGITDSGAGPVNCPCQERTRQDV